LLVKGYYASKMHRKTWAGDVVGERETDQQIEAHRGQVLISKFLAAKVIFHDLCMTCDPKT